MTFSPPQVSMPRDRQEHAVAVGDERALEFGRFYGECRAVREFLNEFIADRLKGLDSSWASVALDTIPKMAGKKEAYAECAKYFQDLLDRFHSLQEDRPTH